MNLQHDSVLHSPKLDEIGTNGVSVLVDSEGIVRWIDQSENYQRRSDPTRVCEAIAKHLG